MTLAEQLHEQICRDDDCELNSCCLLIRLRGLAVDLAEKHAKIAEDFMGLYDGHHGFIGKQIAKRIREHKV